MQIKILNKNDYSFVNLKKTLEDQEKNLLEAIKKDKIEVSDDAKIGCFFYPNRTLFFRAILEKVINDEEYREFLVKKDKYNDYLRVLPNTFVLTNFNIFKFVKDMFDSNSFSNIIMSYNDKVYQIGATYYYIDYIEDNG